MSTTYSIFDSHYCDAVFSNARDVENRYESGSENTNRFGIQSFTKRS